MSVFARVISTFEMKVRKKCHCVVHLVEQRPRPASRAARSPDPTPNQPGTICRDWVQPNTQGMARSPPMPPPESGRRAGRDPMFSEPTARPAWRQEVAGRSRVVDQPAVRGVSGVADGLHQLVPAASPPRSAGTPVQRRGPQGRGHGEFEVLLGQIGQRVLVADHLALLGELDRAGDHAVRLGQDRVVGRAAAAADGAAAAVEQRQRNAVPGRQVAQQCAGSCGSPTGWW